MDFHFLLNKKEQIHPDLKKKYWDGWWNRIIRHYFYTIKGLQLFNEFRYIVMTVGMAYFALKLDQPLLLPLMFICALPPLDFFGYLSVHHMDKITEFLQVRYATHYSHHNIELQEKQLVLLEEIKEILSKPEVWENER